MARLAVTCAASLESIVLGVTILLGTPCPLSEAADFMSSLVND